MFAAAETALELIPDTGAEMAAVHQGMLRELAQIGMDLARALRAEALAPVNAAAPDAGAAEPLPARGAGRASAGAGADLGLRFSRIARAVRLTLALEARLADERAEAVDRLQARRAEVERRAERQRAAEAAALARREADAATRARLAAAWRSPTPEEIAQDLLEQAYMFDNPKAGDAEIDAAFDEISECLSDAEDDFCRGVPVAKIIETLCKDLELEPNWSAWRGEDWGRAPEAVRRRLSGIEDPAPPDGAGGEAAVTEGSAPGQGPFSPDPAATGPPH